MVSSRLNESNMFLNLLGKSPRTRGTWRVLERTVFRKLILQINFDLNYLRAFIVM